MDLHDEIDELALQIERTIKANEELLNEYEESTTTVETQDVDAKELFG